MEQLMHALFEVELDAERLLCAKRQVRWPLVNLQARMRVTDVPWKGSNAHTKSGKPLGAGGGAAWARGRGFSACGCALVVWRRTEAVCEGYAGGRV